MATLDHIPQPNPHFLGYRYVARHELIGGYLLLVRGSHKPLDNPVRQGTHDFSGLPVPA